MRLQDGHSMIELVAALIVFIPVFLAVADLVFIGIGASVNDSVCRLAAEAAAAGPPSTSNAPSTRQLSAGQSGYDIAVSVIKVHQPTKLPAQVSDKPTVSEQLTDVPPPQQGGAVDGEVSVTTTVVVTPPFIIGAFAGKDGLSLSSKHVVPFTYVVPRIKE